MSTNVKRVGILGLTPEAIDLSAFPGLTPEKIRDDLSKSADHLKSLGHDAFVYYIHPDDWNSTDQLAAELRDNKIDVLEIGAGVRKIPQYLHIFERLINLIIQTGSTKVKICFNQDPADTVNAILRWL